MSLNQDSAYTEVERLVKEFKALTPAGRRSLNENATRQGFILPLFRALGWNIDDINERIRSNAELAKGTGEVGELDDRRHALKRRIAEVDKEIEAHVYDLYEFAEKKYALWKGNNLLPASPRTFFHWGGSGWGQQQK